METNTNTPAPAAHNTGVDRVRAKFKCTSKKHMVEIDPSQGGSVELVPVYSDNPNSENGQFYKWTPGGRIELSTINGTAAAAFEVGKEYFVDFTPAN